MLNGPTMKAACILLYNYKSNKKYIYISKPLHKAKGADLAH